MRLSLLAIGVLLGSCMAGASVQAQPRGRIVLFDDINFGGEQRVVDGEVRDDRNLVNDGFNDRISSARPVADRGSSNSGFDQRGGGSDQRGGGSDQRGGGGFDQRGGGSGQGRGGFDQRGGNDQRGGGGVILYQDVGFGGESRQVSDTITDFRSLRFNDAVSSIRISSGTWEFCSDANFQGRCMTFDKDVQSLVPMNFNDTISSMRRVR